MSARPRGRPRKFDPADVLALASERFRTNGFAATSLDELAEATGLGRPSLHAAFGDKRALYLAALRRAHDRQEVQLTAFAEAGQPLRDTLARLFAQVIHSHLSGERGPSGCLATGTAPAEAVADEGVRDVLCRHVAAQDRLIEELLIQAGSDAPGPHARLVASVLHSMSIRARAGEGRDALERLARDAIRLVAG